ncbi:hypothetical protein BZA05DRAFT_464192 [Tricharina praecox]|uniref:uncharacterized protein n=1 Tax=Tricharina praecox TaxID=43433 RepID=UPI002220F97B|nr:uncharacterized protein BZA05DRAFT_464192 [Tricharina praecox]KAI5842055.1 hypothetical protein BZA05DRAFT_464192 [Tricharina praecox]
MSRWSLVTSRVLLLRKLQRLDWRVPKSLLQGVPQLSPDIIRRDLQPARRSTHGLIFRGPGCIFTTTPAPGTLFNIDWSTLSGGGGVAPALAAFSINLWQSHRCTSAGLVDLYWAVHDFDFDSNAVDTLPRTFAHSEMTHDITRTLVATAGLQSRIDEILPGTGLAMFVVTCVDMYSTSFAQCPGEKQAPNALSQSHHPAAAGLELRAPGPEGHLTIAEKIPIIYTPAFANVEYISSYRRRQVIEHGYRLVTTTSSRMSLRVTIMIHHAKVDGTDFNRLQSTGKTGKKITRRHESQEKSLRAYYRWFMSTG